MDRRLFAYFLVGVLPWTAAVAGTVTFVFPFALVDPNTGAITPIIDYYFLYTGTLPAYLRAWGIGVVLYLAALSSAISGVVFDREDHRLTAGLLVLVGLTQLSLARGFARQPGRFAIPVATIACFAIVWWYEWPAVRHTLGLSSE